MGGVSSGGFYELLNLFISLNTYFSKHILSQLITPTIDYSLLYQDTDLIDCITQEQLNDYMRGAYMDYTGYIDSSKLQSFADIDIINYFNDLSKIIINYKQDLTELYQTPLW